MAKLASQKKTKLLHIAIALLVVLLAAALWVGANLTGQDELNARLQAAVLQNNFDEVRRLIERGAHIDGRVQLAGYDLVDQDSRSPLVEAIENGQNEMARLLIESGAQLYFEPAKYYVSAVRWALYYCNGEMAEYLVHEAPGFDAAREDVNELLLLSAECGYVELVDFWIEHGAEPAGVENKTGQFRGTPLNRAVMSNHPAVATVLVEHGAPLNAEATGYPSGTPLAAASKHATAEMVSHLIELGAHPNQMSEGKTPLHWAVEADKPEVVETLLNARADPTLPDTSGEAAADLAKRINHIAIVNLLNDGRD